jgi:hypothetical protein
MMSALRGLPIIVSDRALQHTAERLFPPSRHRSRRIHKKLVKRFGGEFCQVPAIWKTPTGLVMHPVRYAELLAALAAQEAARHGQ